MTHETHILVQTICISISSIVFLVCLYLIKDCIEYLKAVRSEVHITAWKYYVLRGVVHKCENCNKEYEKKKSNIPNMRD